MVRRQHGIQAIDFAASIERQTRANAAGHFKLTGLASGRYAVNFSPCTSATATLGSATLPVVQVAAPHAVTGVSARLPLGGSVSGTVSGAAHPGRLCVAVIPARAGRNLGDTRVSLRTAETGADGTYQIGSLAPGSYFVYFNDPSCAGSEGGPLQLAPQWYSGELTRAAADKVVVTAGKISGGTDAALQAMGGITGTVTTAAHGPAGGECVTAEPQNTQPDPISADPQQAEIAISGRRTGRYSLIDLPPGQYKIKFGTGCGAAGFMTQWWDGVRLAGKATIITVAPATITTGIDAALHR